MLNKIVHVSIVEKFRSKLYLASARQKHPSTCTHTHTHTHTEAATENFRALSLYFYGIVSLSKYETIKEKTLVDLTI